MRETRATETAWAKINLALHVRERMADGYHRIETLFAFCEDGDVLRAEAAEELSLAITGPFADGLSAGEDNLVMRAARTMAKIAPGRPGAALRLDKRLPVAAGIGGGSADAAATLRLLAACWGVEASDPRLLAIAAELGADVPACLLSRTARGEGRGDRLTALETSLGGTAVLLVNPRVALSTAAVFARWDGKDRGSLQADLSNGRNDLEAPAKTLCPVIDDVLDLLAAQPGASLVRMSGSGGTCFALFDDAAACAAADAAIAAREPGWWRMRSRLR